MSEIDRNIIEYDISILKKNIKNLMKEKHITQTALANKAGMDQSRISAILSGKSSDCFTVPQLVYIARVLNVSTDTLLGLDAPKEPEHELCMSDICSKLFELDDMVNLKIGSCRTGEVIDFDEFTDETTEKELPGIYFDNQPLSDFLQEWADIKSINTSNTETKTKLLQLWKNERLSTGAAQKSSWHFRSKREQARHLANLLLQRYEEPLSFFDFDLLNDDSASILQEYIDSGEYILDFDEDDRRGILSEFKDVFGKQDGQNTPLIAPPPFKASE